MKILVFTGLYPNNVWPNHGIFIQQRMAEVAKLPYCDIRVVVPVPYYPPVPIGWRAAYRKIDSHRIVDGVPIDYPRYVMIPKLAMALQGVMLFCSVVPFVRRLKKTFPFDVIDAHYVYPDGLAAVLLGWCLNVPVVVSARGSDLNVFHQFPIIRRIIQWTLSRAQAVITVSQALKDVTVGLGIPPEKVQVIPNGVHAEKFSPMFKADARQHLGLSVGERKVIVSVGHLTPNKGFHLLIKTLKELSEKSYETTPFLLIVGGGAYQKVLERLVEDLGVAQWVRLVGAVPHEQLIWYYNAADIVCLMSEREGWPNVILEALACGRPVVATNVGGIPEILTSPDVGRLVERDVPQLVRCLEQALQQEWDVSAIVAHARAFSWTRTARSVMEVLTSAVAHTKPSNTSRQS
ncbi:MAG: glycosyl transferase family 1 [Nitrospirales bacterium]|nr:MAG: glycosyl transferase family 1 [Nitrospirales bacterium]